MLKLVSDNPFRVLGVFSNSKQAEIIANCDDMEAYLSIGQTVSFDLDFDNVLPKLKRTQDSVQNAKTCINLAKDKLKYALFWFCKDSSSQHAINQIKNGDLDGENDVFERDDSYATRINKSIIAYIKENVSTAISCTFELIHTKEYREEFVNAICGATLQMSEDDLLHLYVDTLLTELGTTELRLAALNYGEKRYIDYINQKSVEGPINKINEQISKAKSVNRENASANYKAGIALMKNTKSDLKTLSAMLGTTDFKYQLIADDLAETILQCGINYFNNTDDDDDVDKALVLQDYACEIAVGQMCKDRCNKNLKILQKKKEEGAIKKDLDAIAELINDFQRGFGSSIAKAKSLANDCKPYLQSIKAQIGSTNNLYLQISSAVVSNALGMVISVINDAQNNFSNASPASFISSLKNKINDALSVLNMLSNFDMTSSERSRLSTNKTTLSNMKNQVDVLSNRISGYSGGGYQGGNSGGSSGGCYIATMCYGDYDHPQVLVLRDFRDSVLQQHSWGRSFVKFYYRYSPTWVEHLKDKVLINNIIRTILDKFIILYKYVKK